MADRPSHVGRISIMIRVQDPIVHACIQISLRFCDQRNVRAIAPVTNTHSIRCNGPHLVPAPNMLDRFEAQFDRR